MSLSKTGAMEYEPTPFKKTKTTGKSILVREADRIDTPTLVWLLVKRHKVGLLLIGNVILVLNWILPPWFAMLQGLIG